MSDPVQAQVDAYNKHDLDAFLSCFHDDAQAVGGNGEITAADKGALRAAFGPLFRDRKPHAEIVARTTVGNWTVDHEIATFHPDGRVEVLVAYEVRDGLISRMIALR